MLKKSKTDNLKLNKNYILHRKISNTFLKLRVQNMLNKNKILKLENPIDKFLFMLEYENFEKVVNGIELEYKMMIFLNQTIAKKHD